MYLFFDLVGCWLHFLGESVDIVGQLNSCRQKRIEVTIFAFQCFKQLDFNFFDSLLKSGQFETYILFL